MVKLDEFIISDDVIEKINDEEILKEHLEQGKPLQDLFGFSDETTLEFYETAKNILEQKRFEDAVSAFIFLTTLNPYISEFWLGLGVSQEQNNSYDDALYSYSIAYTLDGGKIFPYIVAARCCIEAKDFDKALDIIEIAQNYAKEHSDEENVDQLTKDASAAKKYVLEQKKKG